MKKTLAWIAAFFDWIASPYPPGNPFPFVNGKHVSKVELSEQRELERKKEIISSYEARISAFDGGGMIDEPIQTPNTPRRQRPMLPSDYLFVEPDAVQPRKYRKYRSIDDV